MSARFLLQKEAVVRLSFETVHVDRPASTARTKPQHAAEARRLRTLEHALWSKVIRVKRIRSE